MPVPSDFGICHSDVSETWSPMLRVKYRNESFCENGDEKDTLLREREEVTESEENYLM